MGGDRAPEVVVEGAVAAARRYGARVILVGDQEAIHAELAYLMDLEKRANPERDPEALDLLAKVKRYRTALLDWELVLDGVGFLSVNAPL